MGQSGGPHGKRARSIDSQQTRTSGTAASAGASCRRGLAWEACERRNVENFDADTFHRTVYCQICDATHDLLPHAEPSPSPRAVFLASCASRLEETARVLAFLFLPLAALAKLPSPPRPEDGEGERKRHPKTRIVNSDGPVPSAGYRSRLSAGIRDEKPNPTLLSRCRSPPPPSLALSLNHAPRVRATTPAIFVRPGNSAIGPVDANLFSTSPSSPAAYPRFKHQPSPGTREACVHVAAARVVHRGVTAWASPTVSVSKLSPPGGFWKSHRDRVETVQPTSAGDAIASNEKRRKEEKRRAGEEGNDEPRPVLSSVARGHLRTKARCQPPRSSGPVLLPSRLQQPRHSVQAVRRRQAHAATQARSSLTSPQRSEGLGARDACSATAREPIVAVIARTVDSSVASCRVQSRGREQLEPTCARTLPRNASVNAHTSSHQEGRPF
ncbi:hypothetical protein CT0861_13176 [Colletotrichum tofieldiae]|uniref:Uncharacterized protein n=1 Tax=Colletotrichum tofieldiae TaxID=708197 RepID=A0A166P7H0_9PEZI|nr:hypothetical protein CT0861_13176 [Colletotrichum tofieldiae]